jgi:quercetin dioxygenase-like cupin family protein
MFRKADPEGYQQVAEGVGLKALVHGQKTLLSEFRLEQGASIPPHRHPHEQTGYLVSGCLRIVVEDETFEAKAGDSWCISGDSEHAAEALEDSIAVEVFSPVREDYLP